MDDKKKESPLGVGYASNDDSGKTYVLRASDDILKQWYRQVITDLSLSGHAGRILIAWSVVSMHDDGTIRPIHPDFYDNFNKNGELTQPGAINITKSTYYNYLKEARDSKHVRKIGEFDVELSRFDQKTDTKSYDIYELVLFGE